MLGGCGEVYCAVDAGLTVLAVVGGATRRTLLSALTVRTVLCGATVETVLGGAAMVDDFAFVSVVAGGTLADSAGSGGFAAFAGCAGCVVAAAGVAAVAAAGVLAGFAVLAVAVAGAGASAGANPTRSRFAATLSLVITGLLDGFRFVRFASATRSESWAETVPATSKARRAVLNMIRAF